jgi:hypothetical protein
MFAVKKVFSPFFCSLLHGEEEGKEGESIEYILAPTAPPTKSQTFFPA